MVNNRHALVSRLVMQLFMHLFHDAHSCCACTVYICLCVHLRQWERVRHSFYGCLCASLCDVELNLWVKSYR